MDKILLSGTILLFITLLYCMIDSPCMARDGFGHGGGRGFGRRGYYNGRRHYGYGYGYNYYPNYNLPDEYYLPID